MVASCSFCWVFVADHTWPIHIVLLVLVVGRFHKLAIIVGQYFRKFQIIVPTCPLQTVVDIYGS